MKQTEADRAASEVMPSTPACGRAASEVDADLLTERSGAVGAALITPLALPPVEEARTPSAIEKMSAVSTLDGAGAVAHEAVDQMLSPHTQADLGGTAVADAISPEEAKRQEAK